MTASVDIDHSHPTNSALYSWTAHVRVWTLTVLGLAADLWSKHWAFHVMTDKRHILIEDCLSFQRSLNPGALFGMGQNWSPLFIGASLFAMVFVVYVFSRSTRHQRSFHVGLGCVLAGALGNLYDRLFNDGKVRDFIKIDLRIAGHDIWPWIFNIADVLLVIGVGLLMINIWFEKPSVQPAEPGPATAESP